MSEGNFIAYRILGLCFFLSTFYIDSTPLDSCLHGFCEMSDVLQEVLPLWFFPRCPICLCFLMFEYNFKISLTVILFDVL